MDEFRYQVDLLKAINQKLESEIDMFHTLLETSSNAFLFYSFADDSFRTLGDWDNFYSFQVNSVRDFTRIYDTMKEEYVLPVQEAFFLEKRGLERASIQFCKQDGIQWCECEVNMIYHEDKTPLEKVIRFRDITKMRRQNEELSYMAYYDMLTGMYNRNYFVKELSEWVKKAEEEKAVVSVAFVDIDEFRKINDGLGILIGDELIQSFGQFLSEFEEEGLVMCSHFNSDLYCMAVYDPFGKRSMSYIYKQLHERTEEPFILTGGEQHITFSMGVAEYPEAAGSALELINCAEIVMFKAKHTRNVDSIRYFDAPIINEFRQNILIERELKKAVLENEFLLLYQPQFESDTKELRGCEALIRWQDDKGKVVSPASFIPIAEKSSLIISIGNWVLEKSFSVLAEWKELYGCSIKLSINISAVQFKEENFVGHILDLLTRYTVEPEEIELEITESVLIDDFENITKKMSTLNRCGINIAIDDFGTGYSSLAYLKGLPINTIKIDKSFIDTMLQDGSSSIIVESIINMVNRLGYDSIAEGVEEEEQYAYLRKTGCKYIQGYLLGKPLPQDKMEELLKRNI